jgi:hypothetical protein
MTAETKVFVNADYVLHLLELIAASEKAVQFYQKKGQDLMVRQYQHLKEKDIQQLNQILKEAGAGIKTVED